MSDGRNTLRSILGPSSTVDIPAFSTAMGELLEEEFEIEGIKPIKFPEGLKLSPIEMGLMEEVVDMSAFLDDEDED